MRFFRSLFPLSFSFFSLPPPLSLSLTHSFSAESFICGITLILQLWFMHYHPARLLISLSLPRESENKIVAYYEHVNNPTYGLDTIERRIISVIYVPIITPITFLPERTGLYSVPSLCPPPSFSPGPAPSPQSFLINLSFSFRGNTLCLFHLFGAQTERIVQILPSSPSFIRLMRGIVATKENDEKASRRSLDKLRGAACVWRIIRAKSRDDTPWHSPFVPRILQSALVLASVRREKRARRRRGGGRRDKKRRTYEQCEIRNNGVENRVASLSSSRPALRK